MIVVRNIVINVMVLKHSETIHRIRSSFVKVQRKVGCLKNFEDQAVYSKRRSLFFIFIFIFFPFS